MSSEVLAYDREEVRRHVLLKQCGCNVQVTLSSEHGRSLRFEG